MNPALPAVLGRRRRGVAVLLRRTVRHGRRGHWGGPAAAAAHHTSAPVDLLGRRFASGEIDEDEYW